MKAIVSCLRAATSDFGPRISGNTRPHLRPFAVENRRFGPLPPPAGPFSAEKRPPTAFRGRFHAKNILRNGFSAASALRGVPKPSKIRFHTRFRPVRSLFPESAARCAVDPTRHYRYPLAIQEKAPRPQKADLRSAQYLLVINMEKYK